MSARNMEHEDNGLAEVISSIKLNVSATTVDETETVSTQNTRVLNPNANISSLAPELVLQIFKSLNVLNDMVTSICLGLTCRTFRKIHLEATEGMRHCRSDERSSRSLNTEERLAYPTAVMVVFDRKDELLGIGRVRIKDASLRRVDTFFMIPDYPKYKSYVSRKKHRLPAEYLLSEFPVPSRSIYLKRIGDSHYFEVDWSSSILFTSNCVDSHFCKVSIDLRSQAAMILNRKTPVSDIQSGQATYSGRWDNGIGGW